MAHRQTFYGPDTPEVNSFMEEICGNSLNIKSFSHRETMMTAIEECKERCEGVYFELPSNDDKINYSIYTNRIKLRTDQKYVTDTIDGSFSRKL